MPTCEFCGCWTTETIRIGIDPFEVCSTCFRASLAAVGQAGPPGEDVRCARCDHRVAEHAAEVVEGEGVMHVGCAGRAGEVAAVAPCEPGAQGRRTPAQAAGSNRPL